MANIYVDQLSFEFEETPNYHDILSNSGSGSQTIGEVRQTLAHIYVDSVSLVIPVGVSSAEIITNTGNGSQTIEEVITGTPVPVEPVPVPTGAPSGGTWFGGSPYIKEVLTLEASNKQEVDDQTYVTEEVVTTAYNLSGIQTTVRRPIYRKVRQTEILPYILQDDIKVTMVPPSELVPRRAKKEEEEMILLGII